MTLTLPRCLQNDDDEPALRLLQRYYAAGSDGPLYTGSLWDTFDPSGRRTADADRFTSDDLVSLALLSEQVPARPAHALLATRADHFYELLAAVGPDRDLGDQTERVDESGPGSRLYAALRDLPGIGPTRASKLLARKRPRLFPIRDALVERVLGLRTEFWEPLRETLIHNERAVDRRLGVLRDAAHLPPQVSRLRVLDVLAWSEGKERGLSE